MIEFSAPYNWCDRICERCPLAAGCPVFLSSEESEGASLVEQLEQAAAQLETELEADAEDDTDDDESTGFETTSSLLPDGQPLFEAGRAYAFAVLEHAEEREGLFGLAMLLYGKIARVSGMGATPGDDVWACDVVPNLLLIERTLDVLSEQRELGGLVEQERAVRALLAPWLDAISYETREAVRILAAAGRAPSPFAQR
ncbi:MAG TPA: hypothetical protein VFQ53_09940 [Kofleriaceae bacterium]|nr:hypothetical protein [Kofleriaceae bacterium]